MRRRRRARSAARSGAWAAALLLALAGCGETLREAGSAIRGLAAPLLGPEGFAPMPAAAAGEPGLELHLDGQVLHAALAQETGERRLWRSADGVALATEGARVVATAGLPRILVATRFDGPDPLERPLALEGGEAASRRLVDLATADGAPHGMRFGIPLSCRLRAEREADDLLLIEERCLGPEGIAFSNRFWAGAGGEIRQSEQWIGRGVPMLGLARR